ncbi:chromate transporter [Oceanivirga salmonicida]|uniref:chromate transporter n=1 Tax=Oceanivirga salmonicida TaxID=1769291 RepID=UPI000833C23C|nr:chromate transporter [Oceanivirga salmonicida]
MIYIKLYFTFLNIGILAFGGGYAILPLIQKYVIEQNQWLDTTTMVDLISISQITPGPIAINSASFIGNKIGGVTGSIIATLGVITPQIIILSIFLYFAFKKANKYLVGINAAVVALVLITTIKLIKISLFSHNDYILYILFVSILVMYYKKVDIMKLIVFGGFIGLINGFV